MPSQQALPPPLPLQAVRFPLFIYTSLQKCRNGLWIFFFSFPFVSQKTRQDVKGSEGAKNIPQIPQTSRSSLPVMAMTPNLAFLCQEGGL